MDSRGRTLICAGRLPPCNVRLTAAPRVVGTRRSAPKRIRFHPGFEDVVELFEPSTSGCIGTDSPFQAWSSDNIRMMFGLSAIFELRPRRLSSANRLGQRIKRQNVICVKISRLDLVSTRLDLPEVEWIIRDRGRKGQTAVFVGSAE